METLLTLNGGLSQLFDRSRELRRMKPTALECETATKAARETFLGCCGRTKGEKWCVVVAAVAVEKIPELPRDVLQCCGPFIE